jgi:hypothetical protein
MKYTIERSNGTPARHATSLRKAISIARAMLSVPRVYRGAQYLTDRPNGEDLESCEAIDIWRRRDWAHFEMANSADAVISWKL